MTPKQLPSELKPKLDALERAVAEALDDVTLHTHAIAVGWSWDVKKVLNGGRVHVTGKPPIDYNVRKVTDLYKEILRHGVLFAVIIRGERASPKGRWALKTVLISIEEARALEAKRRALDSVAERELRRFVDGVVEWDRVSYGVSQRDRRPELIRFLPTGLERNLDVRPALTELFPRVRELYKSEGLDLVTARWTLRPSGIEFEEYFE